MEQGTLWELDPRTEAGIALIWGQCDAAVRTETMTKLSVLMVKAIRPHPDPRPGEKESDHE
jgi:hypothetical protein